MPGPVGKTSSPTGTAETKPVFVNPPSPGYGGQRAATRLAPFSVVPAGLVCNTVRPRRSNAGLFSKCPCGTRGIPAAQKLGGVRRATKFLLLSSADGADENSPQFQLRVCRRKNSKVPQGRWKTAFQPSRRDSTFCQPVPALKCRAIFDGSFGTRRAGIALDK